VGTYVIRCVNPPNLTFFSVRAGEPQLRSNRDVWKKYLADSYNKNMQGVPGETKFCGFITTGTKLSQLAGAGVSYPSQLILAKLNIYIRLYLHPHDSRSSWSPARIHQARSQVSESALQSYS
jgi:hypothetical protein